MGASEPEQRQSMWEYYDRRVAQGARRLAHAHAYWTGLGVAVELHDIAAEAIEVERRLRSLEPVPFVEVGCGPGTFTSMLAGSGIAVDQSHSALRLVRSQRPRVPVLRADAGRLPVRDHGVVRYFAAHLYGLLQADDRLAVLLEARRVAREIVILDAGCPVGVKPEEWRERMLPDGKHYRIYRRHFDPAVLAEEIEGEVLFAGRFYVMARAVMARAQA